MTNLVNNNRLARYRFRPSTVQRTILVQNPNNFWSVPTPLTVPPHKDRIDIDFDCSISEQKDFEYLEYVGEVK